MQTASSRLKTPLLAGGLLIILVAMAFWGGTTRPGPLFWTGVGLLAATLPAWGFLIWWLLFSPLPGEPAVQGKGLSASGRQMVAITMTISSILFLVGGLWDESWHRIYGIESVLDDFFWRPHQLIYISLGLTAGFAFAGLLVVLRRPGSLRARFRSEPTMSLLALVAFYLTIAAPIDAVWHEIYGLDLSGWSLPHIVMLAGVTLVMLSAVLLQVSLTVREGWTRLRHIRRGDWLALLLLTTTSIIFMLVVLSDWEYAKAPDSTSAFASAFWSRPAWLLPVTLLATATFFGSIALHALRRVGAATLLGVMILGTRALVALVFRLDDSSLSMTFVMQLAVLPPLAALDIAYYFLKDRDAERSRLVAAAAALAGLLIGTVPLLPGFLEYFVPDFGLVVGAVLVGLPTAFWFTWTGAEIGTNMYRTPRLVKDGVEIIRPQTVWLSFGILAAATLFVLFFIMTSTPPA